MDMKTLMWSAAIGQTIFVVTWATMPWWRTWVGGALMTKSASLCAVLWFWVIGFYAPEYPHRDAVRQALVGAVAVGIWLQVGALAAEIRKGKRTRDTPTA